MRVAILGLGSAGRRHAMNFGRLGAEVIGWDPAAGAGGPGIERAASCDEALSIADAVVVASPSAEHAAQAVRAIGAGKPVLVEKPIATALPDAVRVATLAERAGVACAVAMNLRFHPAIRELKRLLDGGELGAVLRAGVWFGYDLRRWRPESDYRASYSARAELGGGIVLDAIHELDYLLWLLGPVAAVTATTARVSDLEIDVEDTAVAIFELASGALATADLNFVEAAYRRGCVISGTEATASWDWNDGTIVVADAGGQRVLDVAADVADTYRAEAEDFLAVAEGRGAPSTPVAEGVEAVRLADAIKRSADARERVLLAVG